MCTHLGLREVSGRHFDITFEGDVAFVTQGAESVNGVFINDQEKPLGAGQRVHLQAGDRIHVVKIVTVTKRRVVTQSAWHEKKHGMRCSRTDR